jgi:hypothetical protein
MFGLSPPCKEFQFLRALAAVVLLLAGVAEVQAAALPDPWRTPGMARLGLLLVTIPTTRWGRDARQVIAAMKRQIFTQYGLSGNTDPFWQPKGCEIDYLVSQELGGADAVRNLWPQSCSWPWNAHLKDRMENRLHKEVCGGAISLGAASAGVAKDGTALYRRCFGYPQP